MMGKSSQLSSAITAADKESAALLPEVAQAGFSRRARAGDMSADRRRPALAPGCGAEAPETAALTLNPLGAAQMLRRA